MHEEKNQGRNRRSLRNIRFMRGTKLRILFGGMSLGMVFSSFMLFDTRLIVKQSLSNVTVSSPALQSMVEQTQALVSGALLVGVIFTLTAAVLALLFGFMVSHRFYGPIVPLSRHLQELAEGKYQARVKLRPGDELLDLMEAQNALAAVLESGAPLPPHTETTTPPGEDHLTGITPTS